MIAIINFVITKLFNIILFIPDKISVSVSILLLSIISAVIILLIISVCSNQKLIKKYKNKIKLYFFKIYIYKDNYNIIKTSILNILKYNMIYLVLFIPPILFNIIPISLIGVQVYNRYMLKPVNQSYNKNVLIKFNDNFYEDIFNIKIKINNKNVSNKNLLRIPDQKKIWFKYKPENKIENISIGISNFNEVNINTQNFEYIPNRNLFIKQLLNPLVKPVKSDIIEYIYVEPETQNINFIGIETDPLIFYFIVTLVFCFILKRFLNVEF